MGKLFKGLLAAAALAWGGSAQAGTFTQSIYASSYFGGWLEPLPYPTVTLQSVTVTGSLRVSQGYYYSAGNPATFDISYQGGASISPLGFSFNFEGTEKFTLSSEQNEFSIGGSQYFEKTFVQDDPGFSLFTANYAIPLVVSSYTYAEAPDANFSSEFGSDGFSGTVLYNFIGDVPEPSTWAMLLIGFAAVGMAMRRRPKLLGAI